MAHPRLAELVDVPQLRRLLDTQAEITGMPMGLMDPDGTLLVASGWRDICTHFHRVHPASRDLCHAYHGLPSDGDGTGICPCPNGLWDLKLPITVAGEHVATLMLGQFLYEGERPSSAFFRTQAERLGFDMPAYLEALSQVPTFSREEVARLRDFMQTLVGLIAELGLQRLRWDTERQERIRAEQSLRLAKDLLEDRIRERTLDLLRANESLREREANYRRIVDHIRDVIYTYTPEGLLTFVSESVRQLGYAPQEMLGRSLFEFIHPEDRDSVARAFEVAVGSGRHERIECRILHADGGYGWYEEFSEPMYQDGRLLQVNGVVRDISERKAAEESLRESEGMYRALVEHSHDGIYIFTGRPFLYVNRVACEISGHSLDELYTMGLGDLLHHEDRGRILDYVEGLLLGTEGPARLTARIVTRDGELRRLELSLSRLQFGGGWTALCAARDMTERLQAESALRESEERYRTLVENQGEGVGYVDAEETILFMNPAAEEIFGRPRGELIGHSLSEFMDAQSFLRIRDQTDRRKHGDRSTYEMLLNRPDGGRRLALVTATPHFDAEGRYLGALGIFRDITSIREGESERRRLSTAIEQASDSVLMADVTGTILYANPATEVLLGLSREALEGRPLAILRFHVDDRVPLLVRWREAIAGKASSGRLTFPRADGAVGHSDTTLSPVRDDRGAVQFVVITSRDVTREAELEAQLRHSQKMEAIGVLAGGIAHDFNNILMPILGFAELAMNRVEPSQVKLAGYLREIYGAGQRAADLVRQILTFSRQVEQVKRSVPLHPVVKESLKLIRAAIPATITIESDIREDCGPVQADPSQIHQVVMNLCTNAYHAMREVGGRLTVTLDRETRPAPVQAIGGELPPGDYVRIRIADTGCGMPLDLQRKIFLPFFSTKQVGEGTGLGLSIVHGIVTSSGGGILLDSEPGRGSTFTVLLPAAEDMEPPAPDAPPAAPQGTERIMVVDDEDAIGQMLSEILQGLGYHPTAFRDSGQALAAFEQDPAAWDLVLTDFTMPRLTGFDMAHRMHRQRPGLPMILMTGHSEGLDEARAREQGFVGLLRKPVPILRLAEAVRLALGDPGKEG